MQMMACSVLLAALSILPYDGQTGGRSEADAELDKERSMRMATILGFAVDAKRDARWECMLKIAEMNLCRAACIQGWKVEIIVCTHQAVSASVRLVGLKHVLGHHSVCCHGVGPMQCSCVACGFMRGYQGMFPYPFGEAGLPGGCGNLPVDSSCTTTALRCVFPLM